MDPRELFEKNCNANTNSNSTFFRTQNVDTNTANARTEIVIMIIVANTTALNLLLKLFGPVLIKVIRRI